MVPRLARHLWLGMITHLAVSIRWENFAPDHDGNEEAALCAPVESGVGCVLAVETPVTVDDKRLARGLFFPACAWPHAAPPRSSDQGVRACAWRPPANATGCSWPLLVSACPLRAALQQRPSAPLPVTVLYGNGMVISRGALRHSSHQRWVQCAARAAPQPRGRPEPGSDELQSRCLHEITRGSDGAAAPPSFRHALRPLRRERRRAQNTRSRAEPRR